MTNTIVGVYTLRTFILTYISIKPGFTKTFPVVIFFYTHPIIFAWVCRTNAFCAVEVTIRPVNTRHTLPVPFLTSDAVCMVNALLTIPPPSTGFAYVLSIGPYPCYIAFSMAGWRCRRVVYIFTGNVHTCSARYRMFSNLAQITFHSAVCAHVPCWAVRTWC